MRTALSPWIPRASVALFVGAAALVVWRQGGGADPRPPPPRPDPTPSADAAPDRGRGAEGYEVRTRLVEALADALIETPSLAAARPFFQSYWRKVRGPWTRPAGIAGQLVTTISLRTSQREKQWSMHTDDGTWAPKVRVWNMNEGSYDQREAIFAPTPSSLTFQVTVPAHASLRFAPAVAAPLPATTVFEVVVIDAGGVQHALSETRVEGGDARHWHDLAADLSPWTGQRVQLRLRTWTEKPAADEKRWLAQGADTEAEAADGGAAEAPPVPPMSLGLWGDPILVAKEPTRLPFDVLWIVVDALRPDVAAALHDPVEDAEKLAAPRPPLEALLPAVPGLMPGIDSLARRGVHFTHAWSAGAWTRPGTLAMLSGERSSELGIDPTAWVLPIDRVTHYYASDPPMLPLILRKSGAVTAAFVNNFFMAGYAAVGLDTGFERVTDHRYRTRDTAEITRDATAWLDEHAQDRFFLFVNYNSPHEPYDPPPEMLARIPGPPAGPRDARVREYMAEGAKDDAAIGELLDRLEALRLANVTLVVVTSDHGETLSSARTGFGLEHIPLRFHHAVGNFEETTRVPIVLALPGVFDGGRAVSERVRSTDIAPTVLDVEGLEADPRMSGRSMLPLVQGHKEAQPRVVVSEGRGSHSILWGPWRLVAHEPVSATTPPAADAGAVPEDELYNLDDDPGERRNVARRHADVVADLRARLTAALANAPTADAEGTRAEAALPTVRIRFAGAGRVHRVAGSIAVGDGKRGTFAGVEATGIAREAIRLDGSRMDFALVTSPEAPVGFDVRVDPPAAPVAWQLFLDDLPWPDGAMFAGPFGLPAVASRTGLTSEEARSEVYSPTLPNIDPSRDLGAFITRDKPSEPRAASAPESEASETAKREMQRMLQLWGYAHAPSSAH